MSFLFSADAMLLWRWFRDGHHSLLSLLGPVNHLFLPDRFVRDRRVLVRALSQLVDAGRLRRVHRGVYLVASQRVELVELLAHVHPGDSLRVSGPWAARMHLGASASALAHVLRTRQARDYDLPPCCLVETNQAVHVRHLRSEDVEGAPSVADRAQCVLDQLAHPSLGLSMSTLRQLIGDAWPANRMPDATNDRRRLALLVSEQTGAQLDVGVWASHQTIDLDVDGPPVGPVSARLNVRRNA
jgi:hypothetical protein